jgi:hypothetical protein
MFSLVSTSLRTSFIDLVRTRILLRSKRSSIAQGRRVEPTPSSPPPSYRCNASRSRDRHIDAEWLLTHGVFLGDLDDFNYPVNGSPSYLEVIERYWKAIRAGTNADSIEPEVYADATQKTNMVLRCRECTKGRLLEAKRIEFNWVSDADSKSLRKDVYRSKHIATEF